MANELNFSSGVTGQTVIARLYQEGAQVGTDITVPEVSGEGGFYSGDMPAADAGSYVVQFLVGGVAKAGGSIAWDGTREITLFDVLSDATTYVVKTKVDCNSTAGTTAHVKVQLLTANGELVDLHDLDPAATCEVSVIRDGDVPQFDLDDTDMGPPNDQGYFEADYENPNFTADCGYTVLTTVVADGKTYQNRVHNFRVFP